MTYQTSWHIKPGGNTKIIMAQLITYGFNPRDAEYWKTKGWTGRKRIWN